MFDTELIIYIAAVLFFHCFSVDDDYTRLFIYFSNE